MLMEKQLSNLFDFQHFERNERLQKLIDETERKYGSALSDELLTMVNAAGDPASKVSESELFSDLPKDPLK